MKSYSSREVRKMLFADGWEEVNCEGDHHQFKHPTKLGKVTLRHPVKDLSVRDLKSIEMHLSTKTGHKNFKNSHGNLNVRQTLSKC